MANSKPKLEEIAATVKGLLEKKEGTTVNHEGDTVVVRSAALTLEGWELMAVGNAIGKRKLTMSRTGAKFRMIIE